MTGYAGIGPERGKFVAEDEAFQYLKEHLDFLPEREKQEIIDWYYSGNWIYKELV